mmetsp:Transcript_45628/g.102658  ORF Transcript_45628/g.102658 Transcript_45628/m.102658 type:complete len:213 (-) Transcript_45628:497-1135(-)
MVRTETLALQRLEVALELARTASVVPHAGGRQQANVARPLRGEKAVATLAPLVVLGAEEGEVDRPWESFGVVLLDLVPRCEHAHGRGRIAAAAVGLVHDWLEEVFAIGAGPVPRLGEGSAFRNLVLLFLQEAALAWAASWLGHALLHHQLVHVPRWVHALDASVPVDLAQRPAVPLGHLAGLPAKLEHCELLVELRDHLRLRVLVQRLVVSR